MAALVRVEVMTPEQTGASLATGLPPTTSPFPGLQWLVNLLLFVVGVIGGRVRTMIDNSTGVAASGTVTLTQASLTAGDVVGIGGVALTAVAGAADATAGEWSIDTSDAAAGISLAAAINGYPAIKDRVSATDNGAGVVTITADLAGIGGNSISLTEIDASGGIALSGAALSGGLSPGSLQSRNLTFSGTGTNGDTITIGSVVLTLVAAAANENQITIGGSAAATATNTIAVINAHSVLKGLVVASSGGSAIVTCQLALAGRVGALVTYSENGTGASWAGTSFAPSTTEAWAASTATYTVGAPAS